MKKYVFVLFGLIVCGWCGQVLANSMCVANDTVAVILDPTANCTNINGITKPAWAINCSYGRIDGTSACLSSTHGATDYNKVITDVLFEDGERVEGGENTGGYCFCRTTHPVKSRWVLYTNRNYGSTCYHECHGWCRGLSRALLFGSLSD